MALPVTTPIFCYKQALCQSFQKDPPKKTCGKCGQSHNHGECSAYGTTCSSCGKNQWLSNVEALGGGTVQLVTHPSQEGHKIDNKDSAASSSTKAGDEEEATSSTDPLPTRSLAQAKDEEESHLRLSPSRLLNSSQDQHTLPM